ncbi:ABC transporter permease subunit [Anaerovorax odorimutans]|uniref:ABC transporter permease subunit n=1 Tax=Anaerovorax odorimutans TaxID=109327 RepID=A0ABT1RND8_9FIRM|nr:ABC transporter permease subunit [Anaerovorax odorimutans]MCQ4636711.1 ABC transporter permease subunit [Anaerovorax odorimutans]
MMIRLIGLEIKKVFASRMTKILLALALVLSIVMALTVIHYTTWSYTDKQGKEVKITGFKAIEANKERMKPYEGPLTEERIEEVFRINRGDNKEDVEDIYEKGGHPTKMLLASLWQVYQDDEGLPRPLSKIDDRDARNFYGQRDAAVAASIAAKYPHSPEIQEKAIAINEQVEKPFTFVYGYANSDAADYVLLLNILLVMLCSILAAPFFSSDYQTGADDILRCTRNGRTKLACVKIFSALILSTACFTVCMAIFLVIVNTVYGWDSLDASIQFTYSVTVLAPLTAGGVQKLTVAVGFVAFLSMISFILMISSKTRTAVVSMILALVFCLLPSLISSIGSGNIIEWISCLLPAGGVGLTHSFLFELTGTTFLQAGDTGFWSPYVIFIAAAIELPLFLILTVRFYCKHEA